MSTFLWPADLKCKKKKNLFSFLSGRQKPQKNTTFLESQFLSQRQQTPVTPPSTPVASWALESQGRWDWQSPSYFLHTVVWSFKTWVLDSSSFSWKISQGKGTCSNSKSENLWGDKRTEKDSLRFYYQKCLWGGNHLIRMLLNLGTGVGSSILYPLLDATFLICLPSPVIAQFRFSSSQADPRQWLSLSSTLLCSSIPLKYTS